MSPTSRVAKLQRVIKSLALAFALILSYAVVPTTVNAIGDFTMRTNLSTLYVLNSPQGPYGSFDLIIDSGIPGSFDVTLALTWTPSSGIVVNPIIVILFPIGCGFAPSCSTSKTFEVTQVSSAGPYIVTVRAHDANNPNGLSHSVDMSIYVQDFGVSLTPNSLTVAQGGSGTTSVDIYPLVGFNERLFFSVTGEPSGVTYARSALPIDWFTPPFTTNLILDVAASVQPGTYVMNVGAYMVDNPSFKREAPVSLTVTQAPTTTTSTSVSISSSTTTTTSTSTSTTTSTTTTNAPCPAPAQLLGVINQVVTTTTTITTVTNQLPIITTTTTATTSTTTIPCGVTTTTGGTTTSTITSGGTTTGTGTTSTGTCPTPDFAVSSSPLALAVPQGATSTATITVTSLCSFSSPVALVGSWFGAPPTGATFVLPTPLTPPVGGDVTTTLVVTTSAGASVGTFILRVLGTSVPLTHTVDLAIQITAGSTTSTTSSAGGGRICLIATATYGSELAPEVQVLRNFRDNSILKTRVGSNFMIAFNYWYYSFSPQVATYISTHPAERTIMKGVLYPLVGILKFSSLAFQAASVYPELAALLSGLVASSLIGALYVGLPLSLLRAKVRRLRGWRAQRFLGTSLGLVLLGGIGALLIGELFASPSVLMLSTSIIVLSALFLSAALTSAKIAKKLHGSVRSRQN